MSFLSSTPWIVITFLAFTILVAVIASVKTKGDNLESADGYFLASRSLPGVVIAGSLLLTNLSAEQLVGLNGQSWQTNMSPSAFEVGSIFTLLFLVILVVMVGMNLMQGREDERRRRARGVFGKGDAA